VLFISSRELRKMGVLAMNRRNNEYIAPSNPRSRYPLVDDKLLTKRAAEAWGMAVPELCGVIESQFQVATLKERLSKLESFVIKPAQGSGGKGILVITRRDAELFYKPSGMPVTLADIERHISNILSGLYSLGGRLDVAMIEKLVEFDDVFADYSYEGVPDIRVIVYHGFPVMAMLRCSTHASDGKANLHQGAVGVGLDIGSGKALFAVQANRRVHVHPDTGHDFKNLQVPYWHRILKLAAGCYDMTGLGYVGADVVLDKTLGPLILELNARPGLAIQIANRTGLLHRLRKIDELPPIPDVEERVATSIRLFAGQSGFEYD